MTGTQAVGLWFCMATPVRVPAISKDAVPALTAFPSNIRLPDWNKRWPIYNLN